MMRAAQPVETTQQQLAPSRPGQWQDPRADSTLRQQFAHHILQMFRARQSGTSDGWATKMPDFVRRLEDALYRSARSKEEYGNLDTLEARLQHVAQKMVNRKGPHARAPPQQAAQQAQPVPPAEQNQGMGLANQQANGLSPTMGNASSTTSEQGNFQSYQGQQPAFPAQQSQMQNNSGLLQSRDSQGYQNGARMMTSQPQTLPNNNAMHSNNMASNSMQNNGISGNSMQNGGVKLEQPSLGGLGPQGMENMPGYQQPGRINTLPTPQQSQQPVMSNGAPVIMRSSMRDSWHSQPPPPMLNGVANLQNNGNQRISINGMSAGQMGGAMHDGRHPLQGMQGNSYNTSTSLGNMRQVPQSPSNSLRGMAASNNLGEGMQQGRMAQNNMMPINSSNLMPNMNVGGSPMVPMHNPMMHMQHLNPMQGQRRPGSAGMVPVSSGNLPNMNMGGMQGLATSTVENSIIRPNSAAANGALPNNLGPGLPNGMIPDTGMPGSMNSDSLGGSLSNGPGDLGNGHMIPQGLPNGPLGPQSFANGGSGMMGSMPMGSLPMGSVPMHSMALAPPMGTQGSPAEIAEVEQVLRNGGDNKEYIAKQQRWLLFLRHCAKCNAAQGQCTYGQSCVVAKALWKHIMECGSPECNYPRCVSSRNLLKHHQKCTSVTCPICTPVKQYVQKQRFMNAQRQQQQIQMMGGDSYSQNQGMGMSMGMGDMNGMNAQQQMHYARQQQLMQQRSQQQGYGQMMYQNQGNAMMYPPGQQSMGMRRPADQMSGGAPVHFEQPAAKRYKRVISDNNTGTSLLEALPATEIKSHIDMLRASANTIAAAARSKGAECHHDTEDIANCAACGLRKYLFEPLPLFCATCLQKIRRNQAYWRTPADAEIRGYWCTGCYAEEKKGPLEIEGFQVNKESLFKVKNDEESEEGWVQCDTCERWVHQICGLFNKGRNTEDTAYTCPCCLLRGLECGIRKPIAVRPQSMLEAKDLRRTPLSDMMEEHLNNTIQQDRILRAKAEGRSVDEIVVPDGLTVRVINNISKKAEVKQRFYDAFKNEGYPESFPFDQKVVVLFQKIDGVDVLLYCFYVQEFGDHCVEPNKRWVYLSYLDSVKYFQPELPSARGVALRTMVYQDILESYIIHIKQQGYTALFIWACPPFQGDDYILHCHPMRQKVPKNGMLREWYLTITRACQRQGIVTHTSNLWDSYFPAGHDHKTQPSVLNMPYLDGDYWPGEVESQLNQLYEEERKKNKASSSKKNGSSSSRPAKKAKRCNPYDNMDEFLMSKLGEVVHNMKDDFIVVHLQEVCSYCRKHMCSTEEGVLNRWYHPSPPSKVVFKNERSFEGINLDNPGANTKQSSAISKFQICDLCYGKEKSGIPGQARGLPMGIKLDDLVFERGAPIPPTEDKANPTMHNEFFDTRQNFLSLCQGNHYQFDTIRRARHSSMMVLYHLHNPEAPAFASTCNNCQAEIEPGDGYRCTTCQDFDLCRTCKEERGVQHPHPMRRSMRDMNETQVRLTAEQQDDRKQQIEKTMSLLRHAAECKLPDCHSSSCRKVKQLFEHARMCQARMSPGGCAYCRRLMALLQVHSKQCSDPACRVPRCRELREMRRRQTAQQEALRRNRYQQMLHTKANNKP